jgi:hypothetical protein
MSLAEGSAARLAYKFYPTGDIAANAAAVSATDLQAAGAQILRNVSTGIKLGKDTYQSNERRSDRQIANFRHGVRRVSGPINGEFSPKTYGDFFQAAFRGTWSAGITLSQVELTSLAADKATSTFTAGGGDPVALGLRVGHIIRNTNLSDPDDNSRNFIITGFSGASNRIISVFPAPDTMAADTSFTLATAGKRLVIPSTSAGFVKRKVALEIYRSDIALAQLFTECRVGGFDLKLPATGNATIDFPITGRDQELYQGGAAPFFAAPTADTSTSVLAAVNGLLMVNGIVQGVLTQLDIKMDLAAQADPVVGQNIVPEIFLGRSNVTGSCTAMLQDGTLLSNFSNEDEISILAYLTADNSLAPAAVSIFLPRIKFSDADVSNSGETGQTISLPFQALKYVGAAPGVDQTTIQLVDTEIT